jgi:hypothetical protein
MRYIKYAHFLSLDVVLGAGLFQIYLHLLILKTWPSVAVMSALASAVGLIYVLDRWLDNRLQTPEDDRHLFFNRNAILTRSMALFWLLTGLVSLIYLPFYLIQFSLVIGFFVLLYWWAWSQSWFSQIQGLKEICTAFLYAMGIFAPIFAQMDGLSTSSFFCFLGLLFIAFQNLYLFTRVDRFFKILELWTGLYLIFLAIYLQDFMRVVPFFVTFGIHVGLRVNGGEVRSRMLGEMAFFSPILYLVYGIISK